jgi:hypothetical protein
LKPHPKSNNTSILGGCGIQFRQNKQKELFEYTLVDLVRDWRTEWFYPGNVQPSLVVHSDVGQSSMTGGRRLRYRQKILRGSNRSLNGLRF